MESNTFSLDIAKKTLDEEGFLRLEDPALGDDLSEMERKGFPFWTEDGLDFCKHHVLYNPVCRMAYSTASV